MKLEIESNFENRDQVYEALLEMAIKIKQGANSGFYRTEHHHIVKMKWELKEDET